MSEQRVDSGAESAVSDDAPELPVEQSGSLDDAAADSEATTEGARHLEETQARAQEDQRADSRSASASPGGANDDGTNPTGDDIPARSELGHDAAPDGARQGTERIEGSSREQ
jgi:hypothetical protein